MLKHRNSEKDFFPNYYISLIDQPLASFLSSAILVLSYQYLFKLHINFSGRHLQHQQSFVVFGVSLVGSNGAFSLPCYIFFIANAMEKHSIPNKMGLKGGMVAYEWQEVTNYKPKCDLQMCLDQ